MGSKLSLKEKEKKDYGESRCGRQRAGAVWEVGIGRRTWELHVERP